MRGVAEQHRAYALSRRSQTDDELHSADRRRGVILYFSTRAVLFHRPGGSSLGDVVSEHSIGRTGSLLVRDFQRMPYFVSRALRQNAGANTGNTGALETGAAIGAA